MYSSAKVVQVGAPDPELKNSPIEQEADEELDYIKQQVPGEPVCYFNSQEYANGAYVRSGEIVLRCDYGVWIQTTEVDSQGL